MGMQLAYNGKIFSVWANTSGGSFQPGTLYAGLMSSYPANADGLTMTELLPYEFTSSAGWYTPARKIITFNPAPEYGDPVEDGVGSWNTNTLTWTNTSGSTVEVPGIFITNADAGDNGFVYWIGQPDIGTMTIEDGSQLDIFPGGLLLGVD